MLALGLQAELPHTSPYFLDGHNVHAVDMCIASEEGVGARIPRWNVPLAAVAVPLSTVVPSLGGGSKRSRAAPARLE